ncbi:hypothetical protein AX16_003821 [Volvariella volvacea WC 439]|nr:hypothetical protein AX16_003821 [Volvariella volvacea WC 439]
MNLDDVNQGTFFLPYKEQNSPDTSDNKVPTSQPDTSTDEWHIEAYKQSWSNCLNQIRSIISSQYDPILTSILEEVQSPHSRELPGVPRNELPVICITDSTSGSHFVDEFNEQLHQRTNSNEGKILTTHIYPTESSNIAAFMKTMITGFVDSDVLDKAKGKSTASLANYDIEYLIAWYNGVLNAYETAPTLVVLLHNFEQFDPNIMQDVFYICSQHSANIPFAFVLSLSSPHLPSYLHSLYPRSTLSLLRIKTFVVPNQLSILRQILEQTFFSLDYEPDVMLGPTALKFAVDYFSRQSASIDSLVTILQLMHLKHVTSHPLGFLVASTPSPEDLSQPEAAHRIDQLFIHIQSLSGTRPSQWPNLTLSDLLEAVDRARTSVHLRLRNYRIAFRVFVFVQRFMMDEGYKGLDWSQEDTSLDVLGSMILLLQGRLGKHVKSLGMMIKKLKPAQLASLVDKLLVDLYNLPRNKDTEDALSNALQYLSQLPEPSENQSTETNVNIAQDLGNWFARFFDELVPAIEDAPLWEVWYTGQTPFPSELLNPSTRASILASLLRPHEYAHPLTPISPTRPPKTVALWELPDTSILFRRYLDSGKMINVYDWFESFSLVLESQREQAKNKRSDSGVSSSPSRNRGRGRGRREEPESGAEEDDSDDDDEKWRIQVQARFMRALQELDYLGFIKHTGRKPDHVVRTAFDIQD